MRQKKIIVIPIAVVLIFIGIVNFILANPVFPIHALEKNTILKNAIQSSVPKESPKFVALTFDDGPYGDATVKILDILKEKNAEATFFVVGKNVQKYPEILKREIREGHIVGNHSFDHSKTLAILSREKLINNIKNADIAIAEAGGVHPSFFRPPYGFRSLSMEKHLKDAGYEIILWNNAPEDYLEKETSEEIIAMVLKKIKPGAIIDLHDGRDVRLNYSRENLIKALPIIIDEVRNKGYIIVGLDKIINKNPYFN